MANMKEKLFSEFQAPTTQEWLDKIEVDLKGADFQKKLVWRTNEGFNVQPFYRRGISRLSIPCQVNSHSSVVTRRTTTSGSCVRRLTWSVRRLPTRRHSTFSTRVWILLVSRFQAKTSARSSSLPCSTASCLSMWS